jgi:hypothetical protein
MFVTIAVSQNDGDIVKGIVFMTLYSAHLEYEIDCLLLLLKKEKAFTKNEQYWRVSKKIEEVEKVARKLDFEDRGNLIKALDKAKKLSKIATKWFTVKSTTKMAH